MMNERSTQTRAPAELADELDDLRRRLGAIAPAETATEEELERLGADIRRVASKLRDIGSDHAPPRSG